jgi:hypothetical protein
VQSGIPDALAARDGQHFERHVNLPYQSSLVLLADLPDEGMGCVERDSIIFTKEVRGRRSGRYRG